MGKHTSIVPITFNCHKPARHRKPCDHLGTSREYGLVSDRRFGKDCGFGCKVMHCTECDALYVFHCRSYGCKIEPGNIDLLFSLDEFVNAGAGEFFGDEYGIDWIYDDEDLGEVQERLARAEWDQETFVSGMRRFQNEDN